jgi:hypothetical protein
VRSWRPNRIARRCVMPARRSLSRAGKPDRSDHTGRSAAASYVRQRGSPCSRALGGISASCPPATSSVRLSRDPRRHASRHLRRRHASRHLRRRHASRFSGPAPIPAACWDARGRRTPVASQRFSFADHHRAARRAGWAAVRAALAVRRSIRHRLPHRGRPRARTREL